MTIKKLRPYFFICFLSFMPWTKIHAVSCAPCYQTGFTTACGVCSGSSQIAFEIINQSIGFSEEAIKLALGENMAGTVGFPALNDTIEGVIGGQTKNLEGLLEASVKSIIDALDKLPANEQKLASELELAQATAIGANEDGCRATEYGFSSGMKGQSSLGYASRWMKGHGVYVGESSDTESNAPGNGSDPGVMPEISLSQANAALNSNTGDRAAFSIKQRLDSLRERSGNPNATATDLLKPELLVSESNRVFSDQPGDDNISDSERMDMLLTVMNANRPSIGDLLAKAASSVGSLKVATEEHINNMEMSIPMTVVDKLIRARQPLPASVGTEDYLRAIMGSDSPDDAVSADDFVYLTTQYRAHDPDWADKVNVDKNYALQQYTQMEAEALAIKYRRWIFKRDTNLMLAQMLANTVEKE